MSFRVRDLTYNHVACVKAAEIIERENGIVKENSSDKNNTQTSKTSVPYDPKPKVLSHRVRQQLLTMSDNY